MAWWIVYIRNVFGNEKERLCLCKRVREAIRRKNEREIHERRGLA